MAGSGGTAFQSLSSCLVRVIDRSVGRSNPRGISTDLVDDGGPGQRLNAGMIGARADAQATATRPRLEHVFQDAD